MVPVSWLVLVFKDAGVFDPRPEPPTGPHDDPQDLDHSGKIVPQHVGHLFILSQIVTVALMSIALLSVSKHHQEGRGSAANHP